MIELGKLQIRTEQRDKRESLSNLVVKKVKNKSGIVEIRPITCVECSEEYCNGKTCIEFNYDLYTRIIPKDVMKNITGKTAENESGGTKKTKKIKKKLNSSDVRKKNKSRSKTKRQ